MNETTLPPSPNWYLTNIFACSFNGTIAWGARNMIVIAKSNENNKALQYSIIEHAHKTKVTCLAFTPSFEEVNANLVASTGDDNTIKVWNVDTLSMLHMHVIEIDKQPIGVDWSYTKPHVIYSVTSDGYALSWNTHFNVVSSVLLGKMTPLCISSCPHDPHLIAIGSKTGLVYIISFQGKGKIVYKLRGHNTEVISISWCPSEINVLNESANKDLLLATGGKDRSIFIWKAGGDGRYEITLSLPSGPLDSHQHRSKLNAHVGNWIVVHWIEPKLLLASSSWGELISWNLSAITKGRPTAKLIHAYHSRGLFCIAHMPNAQEMLEQDWRLKQRHQIWTLAQDRRVICCGLQEDSVEIDYDISTQGGYVYCIAACPLDTSHIAFGVGDAMLRLWNLSEPHNTSFGVTTLWQKIKGKIRTISWHPEKENLLAYATEEGRIGVFNTNCNRPPILYRQYHRNIVYTISFGPYPHNEQYALYSCAEGELVYYNSDKPNEDPRSIIKKECTEFSWKPDFSCLAVGFENGSISFLNRNLETCGHSKIASETVHCLVWHPESTATDTTFSPFKNYLAVAFRSCTIAILNLSNFMNHFTKVESLSNGNDLNEKLDVYKIHEVVATLTGHVHSVVCLAWSPHISGRLISGSYDRSVQVWNVETQELIATYTGHSGPVMCCMWSPLDPEYIITGSADSTVRIWNIANNLPQEKIHTKPSKKTKKQQSKTNKIADTTAQNVSELACTQTVQRSETTAIRKAEHKKPVRVSYFTKSTKTTTNKTVLLNSLLNIVKKIKEGGVDIVENEESSYHMVPVLFSNEKNLMSFLNTEKSGHVENNKHDHVAEMDIWCDNLKQNLEDAAKEKRLNDYLVSLSASLSMKTWKDMCELYAQQLISEGNPCKAVSYLLCIHKPYKAVEVYQDANLYKEAYVLARCKFQSDDPILINVLNNWGTYSVHIGNFEQAAYIYAKLGEFSNVVKYLARRKHAETLIMAAEIALLCDDNDISKSLTEQAIFTAYTDSEYDTARSIILKFPYLKYQEVYLVTLEELEKVIKKNVSLDMIDTWLNGQAKYGMLQAVETICGDSSPYYIELCQNNICNILDNERMLWLAVGYELSLAVASTDKQQKLKHIITALQTISQYETVHRNELENRCSFLIEVIMNLDTKSLMDEESIYTKTDCSVSTSLRAYLCYALLNWFVYNADKAPVSNNIRKYINVIENLLEDALNQKNVKHWSITNEISKLENQVASTVCKTSMEEEDKNDKHVESLMEKLNALKTQREQFINELVYVPNPVMVYSKANELDSKLLDETLKSEFSEIIVRTWTDATTILP